MQLSVGIGLVGCGTVGSAVAQRLLEHRESYEAASGVRYQLRGIAVRSIERRRAEALPRHLFTGDAQLLAADPSIDILIECAGGTGESAVLVEQALARGAHVVSANKDLIATQGPRLRAIAAACGGSLSYEAAVCGAIPVMRVVSQALGGDEILSVAGVVNGTTNAILCAMEGGAEYAQALADAQVRGYAEADPTSDVEGVDAAHKLALLVQTAFGCAVVTQQIARAGISQVRARDIARARSLGYRIRLIAAAARTRSGIAAEVAPVLVPEDHPFANLAGPQNAVRIVARDAGALLLAGEGAGGPATASAVLGDVTSLLRGIAERRLTVRSTMPQHAAQVEPFFHFSAYGNDLPRYPIWSDGEQNAA